MHAWEFEEIFLAKIQNNINAFRKKGRMCVEIKKSGRSAVVKLKNSIAGIEQQIEALQKLKKIKERELKRVLCPSEQG